MIRTIKKLRYVAVMEDGTYASVSERTTHTGHHVEVYGVMDIDLATVFFSNVKTNYRYGNKVDVSKWTFVPVLITTQYERVSDEEAANLAGLN